MEKAGSSHLTPAALSPWKNSLIWYNTSAMHFRTHCAKKHEGKSGQGFYNDVMVAHDENIGKMLAKLDELGIADNTIVLYSTMFRDGADRIFVPREAASLISAAANGPLFGLFDSYMGYGIVGGQVGRSGCKIVNNYPAGFWKPLVLSISVTLHHASPRTADRDACKC